MSAQLDSSLRLAREIRKAIRLRDEFLRTALESYDAATSETDRILAGAELLARTQEADHAYKSQLGYSLREMARQDGLIPDRKAERR